MLEDRNIEEVGSGSEEEIQGDQSSAEPSDNDQGNEEVLQSFYQLPDSVRQAVSALPEDVRNGVVSAIDQHRRDLERGFHEQIREGREYKNILDTLSADPNIQAYLQNGSFGNQQQQSSQTNQNNQTDYTEKYGDQAAEFMNDLKRELGFEDIQEMKTAIQDLRQTFIQQQRDSAWEGLENMAKEKGLPDPNNYQSSILSILNRNPGLTLDQAYAASLGVDGLQTRPPVEKTKSPPKTNLRTQTPGIRSSASPRSESTEKNESYTDRINRIIKDRSEGKRSVSRISDMIRGKLEKYNQEHGTDVRESDLKFGE